MTRARAARAALLGVALAAGATACTSSGAGAPASSSVPASPAAATSAASAAPPAASSAAPTTPSATPTSAPATTITPHAPPAAPATSARARTTARATPSPSTCTKVTVRIISGGAAQGTEIAALQFTNAGTKTCALGEFPTVVLLRGGKKIGTTSQPSTTRAKTMTLKPGDIAESLLRDYSSCQAALSDSARVTVPGESTTALRPVQLRACTLRVDPLGPPA